MDLKLPPVSSLRRPPLPRWVSILAIVVVAHAIILLVWMCNRAASGAEGTDAPAPAPKVAPTKRLDTPLRPPPAKFAANTYLPARREIDTCGAIDMGSFSAGRDLVYVTDPRVTWESDMDQQDEECDHTMHQMAEEPFRRLVELATQRKARIKVQDTFRPTGIHNTRSLHREGRAIDVTCEGVSLEELAKLCWQAGFDWVLYEGPSKQGAHVHCSVRRSTAFVPGTAVAARTTRTNEGSD